MIDRDAMTAVTHFPIKPFTCARTRTHAQGRAYGKWRHTCHRVMGEDRPSEGDCFHRRTLKQGGSR